jgi:hypothetical protein
VAAITTAKAGFWDDSTVWTGGVIPGNGDTVIGNHVVTLRDARIVGTSPAAGSATNAYRCNANLVLAAGGALTSRGDIGLDTGAYIQQAGASFKFDASLAASPSTAIYKLGSINIIAGAGTVTIAGTSGNHCSFSSDAGGANGRIAFTEDAQIVADYCDFVRIGDASNTAFDGAAEFSGHKIHFGNCTFDANCGSIGSQFGVGSDGAAILELINVTHRSTGTCVGLATNGYTNGTRTVSGCRFAGKTFFYRIEGFDFSDNVFEDVYDGTGNAWKSWSNNLLAIPQSSIGDWPAFGNMGDTYVLRVGAPTNPHGVTTVDGQSFSFTGLICDMPDGTDGAGDMITFNNASSPMLITVSKCIILKSGTDVQVGTLVSCLGGSNVSVAVHHNTFWSDGNSATGIYLGETFTGFAGMLTACHSNIALNKTAGHAEIVTCEVGTVTDVVLAAACHHNGKWNAGGRIGYSTNLVFSNPELLGLNDVWGDPGFLDIERTIKSWDTSLGGAGTVANALTELRKKNDAAGYNSAYTIAALFAYIRAGFTPSNPAYLRGAADNTTIGAVQVTPAILAPVRRRLAAQLRAAA